MSLSAQGRTWGRAEAVLGGPGHGDERKAWAGEISRREDHEDLDTDWM